MLDLKPYLVEFDSERNIKDKIYPDDCQMGDTNRKPVIVTTHDKSSFPPTMEKFMDGSAKKIHFFALSEKKRELWFLIFFYLFLSSIYFAFLKKNKIKLLNAMVFQVKKLWRFQSTRKIMSVIEME